MDYFLNESRARARFKNLLGHANHLIVTTLVGLDAVEKGLVEAAPPELHASWSPQNPVSSARRARRLILDMVLVRAVDAIDIYIRTARRLPSLIQDQALRDSIDGAQRSIFRKIAMLEGRYGSDDPILFALTLVMIAWRNKAAHEEADTAVEDRHRQTLLDHASAIASDYCGLDVERLLAGFDAAEPTFKEAASLINAAQRFVRLLESLLFRDLDAEQYLKELVWKVPDELSGENARRFRKHGLQSVWGRDSSDRPKAVVRHLRQFGITDVRRHSEGAVFSSSLITQLVGMTPTEVYAWADPSEMAK